MFEHHKIDNSNKKDFYNEIKLRIQGVMYEEKDAVANMANVSSILFNQLDEINWAGFYCYKEDQLVLGPFQGKSACIRIPLGRGVCGKAAQLKETQLVKDVHSFEGHIPCDAASQSEIVVPLVVDGQLIGVLDIDSPIKNRFDEEDQIYMEEIAEMVAKGSNWL